MFPPENAPTPSFPYRIEGQVGTGSMGMVFRATEVALERPVAIKSLRPSVLAEEAPQAREDIRQRFLQEARAAAALSHPGVTTVYRIGEEGEMPYIVMEWVEGETLEAVLTERGRLPLGEAAAILVGVLDILHAAHQSGVVHRDVKPSNLLLLRDGRIKVTDFGIARVKGRELVKTQAGVVLATPKFASPEQLRGLNVDGRSDIFSSGVLLFFMLTLRFPFEGRDFLELANAILQKEPKAVSDFVPGLPSGLEAVLRLALKKDREERFATADEMAERLRPFATGSASDSAVSVTPATRPTTVVPVLHNLPIEPAKAIVRVVDAWPSSQVPRQSTRELFNRLLEKPLHAPAFAGAVQIGRVFLFFHDGLLLGAVDAETGVDGDSIAETLASACEARLHPVPAELSSCVVPILTTLLHAPKPRHADLDAAFIHVPALADKLADERFDGLIRLVHGQAWGILAFSEGHVVLAFYAGDWGDLPIAETWSRWVSGAAVKIHVEEMVRAPLGLWHRHALRDFAIDVQLVDNRGEPVPDHRSTSSRIRQSFQTRSSADLHSNARLHLKPIAGDDKVYETAPAYRLLNWAVSELPLLFSDRESGARWRYLVEWLALVKKATLYHDLPRPGGGSDFFDLVTSDDKGKVLHLAHRLASPTADRLRALLERIIAAKTARQKTGDVGGVLILAPSFDEDTLAAYREAITHTSSGRWFSMEESFTGYEGFVRIGPRRGFHLLLVEEIQGTFTPLFPS